MAHQIYEVAITMGLIALGIGAAWFCTLIISNVIDLRVQRTRLHRLRLQCMRDAHMSMGSRFFASAGYRDREVIKKADELYEHRCRERHLPRHLAPSR